MKKFFRFIILSLALALILCPLAACNSEPDDTEATTEATAAATTEKPTANPTAKPTEKPTEAPTDKNEGVADTICIGMTAPLSDSLIGRAVQHGAESAVKEINEAGGIGGTLLSLKVVDDKNDPSLVGGLYAELMSEGMKISLGSVTSSCCKEFAQEAAQDGLFVLTPTATDRELFEYDRLYGMELAEEPEESSVRLT